MDNYPMMSEADTQRRLLLRHQLDRNDRMKRRVQFRRRLFGGLKKLLFFLLMVAAVAGAFTYRNEINLVVSKEINQAVAFVQKRSQKDPLRQGALSYEKEVEAAAGQQASAGQ
jgi:hypothetical protein